MSDDVNSNIYKPFVLEFIPICMRHIQIGMGELGCYAGVPVTLENVADIAGLRSKVSGALAFLLLMNNYPEVIKNITNDQKAQEKKILRIRETLTRLDDNIFELVGPSRWTFPLSSPVSNTDHFKAYTVSMLDLSMKVITAFRVGINAVPEIRNMSGLVMVHSSNSSLSATLACVSVITKYPQMLNTIGEDAMILHDEILDANNFVNKTHERIITATRGPS